MKSGYSLAELCLTLALGGIVGTAVAAALRAGERLARAHAAAVARAEVLRVPAVVLARELRPLDPAADLAAVRAESLSLRAIRGVAFVCASEPDAIAVRYRGLRAPNPDKDSLLLVAPPGRTEPVPLEVAGTARGACPGGEDAVRWRARPPVPPPGAVLLLFERGSYHLSGRAFRYRRGLGGRQPLTAENLDTDRSRFHPLARPREPGLPPAPPAGVVVELAPVDPGSPPRPGSEAAELRLRIPFLNAAGPAGPRTR